MIPFNIYMHYTSENCFANLTMIFTTYNIIYIGRPLLTKSNCLFTAQTIVNRKLSELIILKLFRLKLIEYYMIIYSIDFHNLFQHHSGLHGRVTPQSPASNVSPLAYEYLL